MRLGSALLSAVLAVTVLAPAAARASDPPPDASAVSGATARKTSSLALGHTVTVLRHTGAAASLALSQLGSVLAVWVLRGPGQGPLDVRVGTRRLARLATAAPTRRRRLVALPLTTRGPVRFVAAGAHPGGSTG